MLQSQRKYYFRSLLLHKAINGVTIIHVLKLWGGIILLCFLIKYRRNGKFHCMKSKERTCLFLPSGIAVSFKGDAHGWPMYADDENKTMKMQTRPRHLLFCRPAKLCELHKKNPLTHAKINKTGFGAHSNYFILIDIKRNNQFMLEGIWVLNIHAYVKSGFKKCNKEKQCQFEFMSCILLTSFAKEVSWDPEGYGLTFLYLIHIQNS